MAGKASSRSFRVGVHPRGLTASPPPPLSAMRAKLAHPDLHLFVSIKTMRGNSVPVSDMCDGIRGGNFFMPTLLVVTVSIRRS